jgi:hypothetical protein
MNYFPEIMYTIIGPRVLIKVCETIDGNNCFEFLTNKLNIIVIIGRVIKNDIGVNVCQPCKSQKTTDWIQNILFSPIFHFRNCPQKTPLVIISSNGATKVIVKKKFLTPYTIGLIAYILLECAYFSICIDSGKAKRKTIIEDNTPSSIQFGFVLGSFFQFIRQYTKRMRPNRLQTAL